MAAVNAALPAQTTGDLAPGVQSVVTRNLELERQSRTNAISR
ncbi:MAG: hypothetical protein ACLPQ6_02560 [Steroidobacteraceae bacterium]|jgi:hypothetical protein